MEVLQRTANRGSISTGYDIDNSLKFESDNGEICKMNFSTGGSNQTFTWSFWCKRTETSTLAIIMGNGVSGNDAVYCQFSSDAFQIYSTSGGSIQFNLITDRLFRDTSAWYHIVVAFDTTQSTASDRVKLYVNGVQETSFSTAGYPSLNDNTFMGNGGGQVQVGSINSSGSSYNGYLTEVFCIEGQQLAATDFGEFDEDTGIWKPKAYTGSFGTNYAFYLKFDNSASLGADSSGLGNNFTLTNITSADQALDTPTNNFATYNALVNTNATYGTTGSFVITNGATSFDQSDANIFSSNISTLGVKNGKWYAEFSGAFSNNSFVGIVVQENSHYYANSYFGLRTDAEQPGIGYYSSNGNIYKNATNSAYGNSYTTNDIIGIAVDMDNQYVYFAKNGTWQNSGDPTSGSSGTGGIALTTDVRGTAEFYGIGAAIYSNDGAVTCNFGGFPGFTISSGNADANGYGNFEYAPPSGYYALCTKNLAEFG